MSQASLGLGVIEGFYGAPWSHEARLAMVRTLGELGLESYLYAPKNDPHHRNAWWKSLDGDERRRLEELFALGRSLGVSVVYGLAPERIFGGKGNPRAKSFGADQASDAAFRHLNDRVAELVELGAQKLTIAFDDTWATFLPAFATFERGLLHARVAHRVLALMREHRADAEVFLVPAIYHRKVESMQRGALAYLRGLATLGSEIPIAWTGPNVFSQRIEARDVASLAEKTGLSIWIWNNAITNDWLPLASGEPLGLRAIEKLSFGPVENVGRDVARVSRGMLLNAAREPELTKISLRTLAEERKHGPLFDVRSAHRDAIDRTFGEAAHLGHALYDFTKRHPLSSPGRVEAARLDDRISDYLEGRTSEADLRVSLTELEKLERELTVIDNGELVKEVAPTVRRISATATAARLALERAEAVRTGRNSEAKALTPMIREHLAVARSIRWTAGIDGLMRLAEMPPQKLSTSHSRRPTEL